MENQTHAVLDTKVWLQIIAIVVTVVGSYLALSHTLESHMGDTREILRVNREVCSSLKQLNHQPVDACYIDPWR